MDIPSLVKLYTIPPKPRLATIQDFYCFKDLGEKLSVHSFLGQRYSETEPGEDEDPELSHQWNLTELKEKQTNLKKKQDDKNWRKCVYW